MCKNDCLFRVTFVNFGTQAQIQILLRLEVKISNLSKIYRVAQRTQFGAVSTCDVLFMG